MRPLLIALTFAAVLAGANARALCAAHGRMLPGSMALAASTPGTTQPSTSYGSAAVGGGSGQVWVNTSSRAYHCSGDSY